MRIGYEASLRSMHQFEKTVTLADAQETKELGMILAQKHKDKPGLIFLFGDLGAGKTTLAQGFIKEALSSDVTVESPTYAYLKTYFGALPIHHFDLYRVDYKEMVAELGLVEFIDDEAALRLVEWPERLFGMDLKPDLTIKMEVFQSERTATLRYYSPRFILP
jgi:tRNA threonylcarbamoyladenosine biosynthesis protein TsaE